MLHRKNNRALFSCAYLIYGLQIGFELSLDFPLRVRIRIRQLWYHFSKFCAFMWKKV